MFLTKSTMKSYLEERFRVTPGCWIWIGSLSPKGYGKLQIGNHHYRAHRVSYYVYNGEFDDALLVMHKCDNPSCVNPDHLTLGTNADNMKDKADKKRSAAGANHGMAKLSADEREQVKDLLKCRLFSYRKIGEFYDVTVGSIMTVVKEMRR